MITRRVTAASLCEQQGKVAKWSLPLMLCRVLRFQQHLYACAQRVLWEVGGNLAFGPPTLSRPQNRTLLAADRLEEADLYDRAGAFLNSLLYYTLSPW